MFFIDWFQLLSHLLCGVRKTAHVLGIQIIFKTYYLKINFVSYISNYFHIGKIGVLWFPEFFKVFYLLISDKCTSFKSYFMFTISLTINYILLIITFFMLNYKETAFINISFLRNICMITLCKSVRLTIYIYFLIEWWISKIPLTFKKWCILNISFSRNLNIISPCKAF